MAAYPQALFGGPADTWRYRVRLAATLPAGYAVVLSGVLGFIGLQHFYLGRIAEGLIDVGLTLAWIYCFATGLAGWGLLFLVCDFGHSLTVTFLLLTGKFRDSQGRIVAYPGQKLAGIDTQNQELRRSQ